MKWQSLHPLSNLIFQNPNSGQNGKRRWDRFYIATKLNAEAGAVQISSLIYAMGPQADTIFSSFNLTNEESKTYKVVEKKNSTFILFPK